MKNQSLVVLIIALAAAILLYNSVYIVDETEQVVVTQFGKVVGKPKNTPGLQFKFPFIDTPNYFPKNLQMWDGDPGQIPTLDKTYIWVDAFARWKIVDPVKFFQTVSSVKKAKGVLDDYIDPAVRNFITSYRLIESVRKSNRELDTLEIGMEDIQKDQTVNYAIKEGREKITAGITEQVRHKLEQFGIQLVDVKLKRIDYIDQVRESVYKRMIAERKQIAEKFRSEGKGEAQKITGEKERDLKRITSEAYKTAQELMGTADAEATQIYANSFQKDPEFYSFTKTLEIYSSALNEKSSVVFSTDSEFFKYLKGHAGEN